MKAYIPALLFASLGFGGTFALDYVKKAAEQQHQEAKQLDQQLSDNIHAAVSNPLPDPARPDRERLFQPDPSLVVQSPENVTLAGKRDQAKRLGDIYSKASDYIAYAGIGCVILAVITLFWGSSHKPPPQSEGTQQHVYFDDPESEAKFMQGLSDLTQKYGRKSPPS
ncbi:MAG TPA: hypothetical protein VEL76_23370 [Gemmataceae bacterium]|nr:hypothetical protein [Gemmataceae bacterium]